MLVFAISSQLSFFRGPCFKVLSEFPNVIIILEVFFLFVYTFDAKYKLAKLLAFTKKIRFSKVLVV